MKTLLFYRITSVLFVLLILLANVSLFSLATNELDTEMPPMEMPIVEAQSITSYDDGYAEETFDEGLLVTEPEPLYENIMPLSMTFTQEDMDNPYIWYDTPDNVVTLAATPANTAYTRLLTAIREAPAGDITHIVVPFHINTGTIGSDTSLVTINDEATVVLIGDVSGAPAIIRDTDNSTVSQIFRVQGTSHDRTALVLRNIVLHKASSAAQGIPTGSPQPLALNSQTNNLRGGGIRIEDSANGGGQVILCRGSIIHNTSTDNRGPVDIQMNGRFTMMPGSEMHTNKAENAGGAVHVGQNATFNMRGGVLRDNLANGVRAPLAAEITAGIMQHERGVGGAVIVRAGGTFTMFAGEIHSNLASHTGSTSATNAVGTSNGGGIFVIGTDSTFNMHGGRIHNNEARRTNQASTVITAANRAAFRSGNGGGVYLTGGAVFHMHGGYIQNNSATATGTAASSDNGGDALNLSNGGGVYLTGDGTAFHMHSGEISDNVARRSISSAPTMTGTNAMQVFAGNGGGVHVFDGASFYMHGGEISNNTAEDTNRGNVTNDLANAANISNGGGVFVSGSNSTFVMTSGVIIDNKAIGGLVNPPSVSITGNGGGVALRNGARFIMNTPDSENGATQPGQIIDNEASTSAGGVFVSGIGTAFDMNDGAINKNKTANGGGICVIGGASLTLRGGEIQGNTARFDGGGIHVYGRIYVIDPAHQQTASIVGASFLMEGGVIKGNRADLLAGGVNIRHGGTTDSTRVTFTMTGGEIVQNSAMGNAAGGVNVGENTHFRMSGGKISENWTAGDVGGGGVFVNRGGNATIDGGEISKNEARTTSDTPMSFGGGILLFSNGHLTLQGGEISKNLATVGAGLHIEWASTLTMEAGTNGSEPVIKNNGFDSSGAVKTTMGGGMSIGRNGAVTMRAGEISGNLVSGTGGGVHMDTNLRHPLNRTTGTSTVTFTLNNGRIRGNIATNDGGGIHAAGTSAFTMTSGTIDYNIANNGGGLFVPRGNLSNVSIAPASEFSNNVARNGMRIDTTLAVAQRPRIDPGTVSISNISVIGETSNGSNNFTLIAPHAFTNYDINSTGSQFWRVTYATKEAHGEITAEVGLNNFPVPSGSFISNGAKLNFEANPAALLADWEIWTRQSEVAVDGSQAEFQFQRNETNRPLEYTVGIHTHVVGNFNPIPLTTALTVSKIVSGDFGNRIMDFEFTIRLTDSDGNPLPEGTQFDYIGSLIEASDATIPADGTLTLDSTGSARFHLRHGQVITIESLPLNGYVQIIETPDQNYIPSFTDSTHEDLTFYGKHDTTMLPMVEDRTFHFTNERVVPPPTGLSLDDAGALILLPILVFLAIITAYAINKAHRRTKPCKHQ